MTDTVLCLTAVGVMLLVDGIFLIAMRQRFEDKLFYEGAWATSTAERIERARRGIRWAGCGTIFVAILILLMVVLEVAFEIDVVP